MTRYSSLPRPAERLVSPMGAAKSSALDCENRRRHRTQPGSVARWILLVALFILPLASAFGASYPEDGLEIEWTQPDGTPLKLRVFGNEFYARTATEEGYTVVFNNSDLTYYYAETSGGGGALSSSGTPAHRAVPDGLMKGLKESPDVIASIRRNNVDSFHEELEDEWEARVKAVQEQRSRPSAQRLQLQSGRPVARASAGNPIAGTVVALMILAEFPDDPETPENDPVVFPATRQKLQRYSNELRYRDDGNTDSILGYFSDQSLGKLTLRHEVTAVVELPHPRNYYMYSDYPINKTLDPEIFGDGVGGKLVSDAVEKLKADGYDFTKLTVTAGNNIQSTSVLFAGPNSGVHGQGLWPSAHAIPRINVGSPEAPRYVSRYQITDVPNASPVIGTVCHELGHLVLGITDLYDRDGGSEGIGWHGLMGSGNHLNHGRTPAPINLFSKDMLGWADITDLTIEDRLLATLPATGNRGFRIEKPGTPTEYFLFENRGGTDKWATHVPDQGILIWHVDEDVSGNRRQQMTESEHYGISLIQSDGRFNLEADENRGDSVDAYTLPESFDCGDFFDPFTSCSYTTPYFNNSSFPNANWWDGTRSDIAFESLSWPGESMDVAFGPRAVTNLNDSGEGSLRWAVANTLQGTILFDPSLSGGSIDLRSEIVIDRDTTLDASNLPKGITIRGNALGVFTRLLNIAEPVTVNLNGLTFLGGFSEHGGAIYAVAEDLNINGCAFFENTAVEWGSAIFVDNRFSVVQVSNSTFTANEAAAGCIFNNEGSVTLQNCTVARNINKSNLAGAGIINLDDLRLDNTIVYGNQFLEGFADIQGDVLALGPNVIGVLQGGTVAGPTPITASPALGNFRDNGGPTFTMLPGIGSSAVNAGKMRGSTPNWTRDQRGFPRPAKAGANPVIGAVETPQSARIEVNRTLPLITLNSTETWSLGSVLPGRDLSYNFKIRNAGNIPLLLQPASLTGPDASMFSVTTQPASEVDLLGETTIVVRFRPTSSGEKFAVLNISSNDPDQSPFTLHVSAIGSTSTSIVRTTGGSPRNLILNPKWNRPEEGRPPSSLSTSATATPYDVVAFSVSRPGPYTLTSESLNPNWDNLLFLYRGEFDYEAPLANVLVGETNFDLAQFSHDLFPGITYYAVTTGRANSESGDYTLGISGPGIIEPFVSPSDLSPKNGQTGVSVQPTFLWTSSPDETHEILLGETPDSLVLLQDGRSGFQLPYALSHNTVYYWELRSSKGGSTVSSGVQRFTTRTSIEVTILEDENNGALGLGAGDSLREAIAFTANGEASVLEFAPELSGKTIRLTSPLLIQNDLTIDGSSMPGRVVKVSGENATRVFEIAEGVSVAMVAIEISGGKVAPGENGAGILSLGALSLKDVTVRGNNAPAGLGGGIYNSGILNIESTTISANDAESGGGLYNVGAGASATLTNVTLSGNTSVEGGGGITNTSNAGLALIHNTITENTVSSGRGAGIQIDSGTLEVDNSIIAGNDAINGRRSIYNNGGAIIPGGRNIIGDNTSVSGEFPNGARVGNGSNPLNPLILPLDYYGGRTQTRPLEPRSPALDAVVDGKSVSRDQRGVQRPRGPASDIGAVESNLSSNANLALLAISAGKIDPVFTFDVTEYNISVASNISSARVRLTPESNRANAAVSFNGAAFDALESGVASTEFPLTSGLNVIEVQVTAENGATKEYTISVRRGAPPATNADLNSLTLSSGALNPAFTPAVTDYTALVGNSVSSISVTPSVSDPGATIEVAGSFGAFSPVNSGAASQPLALKVGSNLIEIQVTAKDGVTQTTHTLTVHREAPSLSNATLSNLTVDAGTLSPAFSPEDAFYQVKVGEEVTRATITPTAAEPSATIDAQINGGPFIPVSSGGQSAPLELIGGANLIEVRVTAGDGVTVRAYSLIINRVIRSLEWVSNPGDDTSGSPSISADGLFVAFSSRARNLVDGDRNNSEDIFVYDVISGAIERVSVNNDGEEGKYNSSGGKAHSTNPSISADGRFVAFQSRADNLVPNDTNGENDESQGEDIFVYDRRDKTIERVSLRDAPPFQAQSPRAEHPSISDDGRFVAFASGDNNLVTLTPFDTHSNVNVYVRDRENNSTVGVEVRFTDFRADNRDSLNPEISGNGAFVAFEFSANRSEFPQYQYRDIYVYHRASGIVERITGDYDGLPSDGNQSKSPSISTDGRYVAFESNMDGIDFDDTNRRFDVFVHDRIEGITQRVSVDAPGLVSGFGESFSPSLSGDGRYVAFESTLDGLAPGDTNGASDIFLSDLETGDVTLLPVNASFSQGDDRSFSPSLAFDGRGLAFVSNASNLVDADTNGRSDIYLASAEAPAPSAQVRLASLTWNVDASGSGFRPNVNAYTATVPNTVTSALLHPITADPDARVETRINSGSFSAVDSDPRVSLPLQAGLNTIEVKVTPEDGGASNVYTLAVTRAASADATLAGLDLVDLSSEFEEALERLPLTPFFASELKAYTTRVPNENTALAVIPRAAESNASVQVNGLAVNNGAASAAISLELGANTITIDVTAQDGVAKSAYVVTVLRALSDDASLASLATDVGVLTPAFATQVRNYVIEAPGATTSLVFTATTERPDSTLSVNGEPATTGGGAKSIALHAGVNTIDALVTAPDGFSTRTYTIQVARAPQTNTEISISRVNGQTIIRYTGVLQSSSQVTGPFSEVTNATSPFIVIPDAASKFYIVR